MTEICRFRGIVIQIYYDDHPPAHFHVRYAGHRARIQIGQARVLNGDLPARILRLVQEWAALHEDELQDCWDRSQHGQEPGRIDPLP